MIGEARVARIHVGEASNLNEPLCHVLDADSGELEALYDVFFDEDWLRVTAASRSAAHAWTSTTRA